MRAGLYGMCIHIHITYKIHGDTCTCATMCIWYIPLEGEIMSATVGAVAKLGGCDKRKSLGNEDILNSSSTADRRSCIQKYKHILSEDIHTRCVISCCKYWTWAHTHMHMYKNIHDSYTIHAEGESLIPPTHITLTKLSCLLSAYITMCFTYMYKACTGRFPINHMYNSVTDVSFSSG